MSAHWRELVDECLYSMMTKPTSNTSLKYLLLGLAALLYGVPLLLYVVQAARVQNPCDPGVPRSPDIWCSSLPGDAVGDTGGIIAVSSYSSCSAFEDSRGRHLDCGTNSEDSQMTVLDIALTPGSKQKVQYRARLVRKSPLAGSSSTTSTQYGRQCEDVTGDCSITTEVVIEIEVSDSSVVYQLQPTGLEIPYMNAAFHSNAYDIDKDPQKECSPAASSGGTTDYITAITDKSPFGRDFDRYGIGVPFNWLLPPPIIPSAIIPNDWLIAFASDQYYGSACITPLTPRKIPLNGGSFFSCNPVFTGYLCSAVNPSFDSSVNYGMQANLEELNLERIKSGELMLPASPYSNFYPFAPSETQVNFNVYPFTDDFTWEVPTGFFGSVKNLPENQLKGMWKSCLRKYSGTLQHNTPGRVWAGTYIYSQLRKAQDTYYYWYSSIDYGQKDVFYISDMRPVVPGIGWGPFFPSNNILQPVPAKNGGIWEEGDPWPYITVDRRTDQLVTCSADDDDCVGSASSLFASNRYRQAQPSTTDTNSAKASVPIAVCNAVDQKYLKDELYCSTDRIGAWQIAIAPVPRWLAQVFSIPPFFNLFGIMYQGIEKFMYGTLRLFNLYTADQYYTADTFGTVGEPCQVFQIQPQALPQYAIDVRVYNAERTELLDFVRLSNIQDLAAILDTNVEGTTQQSVDLNSTESMSGKSAVLGANRLVFAELTGYDTVNGKIAPDLYGNIVICNMTKEQTGIYQSDTDPVFGTPLNPWVTSNNQDCDSANPEGRCLFMEPDLCGTGGKVPLPQCLAARPRVEGEAYNPYAWWYYQDPIRASQTSEAFGSSAMPSSRLSEPEVQDLICRSPRYAGVPGWIQGRDWTLEDRLRDQLNTTQEVRSPTTGQLYYGPNAKERALRDALPSHTAGHIVGYYNDWQKERGCQAFLEQAAHQRYLPPNFVVPQAGPDAPCSVPTYAVDGLRLLYFGQTQSNTQSSVRFRVGISGTLLRVESSVSSGVFVTSSKDSKVANSTCSVVRGGTGKAQFQVKNTGTVPGTYLILAKCSNGVRQVGETVFTLLPDVPARLISVRMEQTGFPQAPNLASCTFNLTHPDFRTQLVFSQLIEQPCSLLLLSSAEGVGGKGSWQQEVNLSAACTPDDEGRIPVLCQPPNLAQPFIEANGTTAGWIYYFTAVFVVFITVFIGAMNIMSLKS